MYSSILATDLADKNIQFTAVISVSTFLPPPPPPLLVVHHRRFPPSRIYALMRLTYFIFFYLFPYKTSMTQLLLHSEVVEMDIVMYTVKKFSTRRVYVIEFGVQLLLKSFATIREFLLYIYSGVTA